MFEKWDRIVNIYVNAENKYNVVIIISLALSKGSKSTYQHN